MAEGKKKMLRLIIICIFVASTNVASSATNIIQRTPQRTGATNSFGSDVGRTSVLAGAIYFDMKRIKKSYSFNPEIFCTVELLSNRQAGQLAKRMFEYMNGVDLPYKNRLVEIAFIPIKEEIDRQYAKSKLGERHWNWKNGATDENRLIRNSSEIKYWRIEVFKRDNYTCQKCFQVGGILHAHHIKEFAKYPELRFEITNGLTVCKSCHHKIHSKHG